VLLLLKIVLVPVLIGGVTLAARRWGPRIGGLLTGLPVVAGPTLCFYAVEQGDAFAASAAQATLLGLVSVAAFCVAYMRMSLRVSWPLSVLVGWLAFGVATLLLYRTEWRLTAALGVAMASCLMARYFVPSPRHVRTAVAIPAYDLPLRMLAAASLVLVLTSLANRLGPALSGLLTPFPVATAIIAGFTHAQRGPEAVAWFFRGLLPGLIGFGLFCFVLAAGLPSLGLALSVGLAIATQSVFQGWLLWRVASSLGG